MSTATDDRETLRSFINRLGLTMDVEEVSAHERPGSEYWMKGARHFRCEIEREGETLEVYFSQGPAHSSEPTPPTVLSCLASDITGVEQYDGDKWGWMEAYDMVSERGGEAWKEIARQRSRLAELLGEEELEHLLYEVRHE